MANKYEVMRDQSLLGEFTSVELKDMALSNKLQKSDLVRPSGSDKKRREAGSLKILEFGDHADHAVSMEPLPTAQNKPQESHDASLPVAVSDDHLTDAIARSGQMVKEAKSALFDLNNLPSRLSGLANQNESILYASRPSTIALILRLLVAVGWVILIGIVVFLATIFGGPLGIAMLLWLLILFPFVCLAIFLKWKNTYYVITNKRTFMMVGIFNVKIKILTNKNIQLIAVNTGLVDRWLGLNTIEFMTAARGGGINSVMGLFGGASMGDVTFKNVNADAVMPLYSAQDD